MKSGLLEHYRVFVAVARAGSLTRAADALGSGQPTISRQLAALERHGGHPLVQRSSRHLSLTERGRALLPHAEAIVLAAEAAAQALQAPASELEGRLRVACSNAFGRRILLPALGSWRQRHPRVRLELLMSDAMEPVVKAGVDLAFRLGRLASSNLVATRIGQSHSALVASHEYVRQRGLPAHPRELAEHDCIAFEGATRWTFADRQGHEASVVVRPALLLSSMDALQDAVLSGLGIASTPTWFWRDAAANRAVQRLLPGWRTAPRPLMAVAATRQRPGTKAEAFIAFVREAWRPFAQAPE